MEMQTLRVHSYGETPEDDRRVTIAPNNVVALAASTDDVQVQGRSLRAISVLFVDGGAMDLVVDHADLQLLEDTIGAYSFG
jgi:hypothetical protein